MDLTARLMNALTDPDSDFADPAPDMSRVTDEQLGDLVAESCAPRPWTPASGLAWGAVRGAVAERRPRFTPEACRRLFGIMCDRAERGEFVDLAQVLTAVEHRTGPLPDLTALVESLLGLLLETEPETRRPHRVLPSWIPPASAGGGKKLLRSRAGKAGSPPGRTGVLRPPANSRLSHGS
ncbi:hypothetical protein [Streptomyces sp. FZ201]|uniref:hypothetical protein n=1 Tax=Streptomyces sp. FZ201 TaxID=3057122 RepID=UPI0021C23010|nr:hypothetical protein [Streptomyces sp. FZ201]